MIISLDWCHHINVKMNTPAFLRHFLRRFRLGAEIPTLFRSLLASLVSGPQQTGRFKLNRAAPR